MEGGEEEPCDDDNVSELGENAQTVFRSEGTDGVTYVLSKLGDHDGERTRRGRVPLPHVIQFQAEQRPTSPGVMMWLFPNMYICIDAHKLARR